MLKELELEDFRGGHVDRVLYGLLIPVPQPATAFSVLVFIFLHFERYGKNLRTQELLSYSLGYINGDILRTLQTRCIYSC